MCFRELGVNQFKCSNDFEPLINLHGFNNKIKELYLKSNGDRLGNNRNERKAGQRGETPQTDLIRIFEYRM